MIRFKEIYTFHDPYIAAASGLVLVGEDYYVVSDDELFLVKFKIKGKAESLKLFEGILPEEKKARKKEKPDLESLFALPDQSIVCVPSGSKKNRIRGAIVSPDKNVKELSFVCLYAELCKKYHDLNIEGAVMYGEKVRLFQRGNGKHHQNAIIDLSLQDFLDDVHHNVETRDIKLGSLNGIPLSFTDACYSDGKFWFLAVAENSESTYLDGDFAGAIIGHMDLDGHIHFKEELEIKHKPEGIVVNGKEIYIVTDADERTIPSKLYSAVLD